MIDPMPRQDVTLPPTKREAELLDEISRLRIALADAINRPMGVVPDSAEGLLSAAELARAADRRR